VLELLSLLFVHLVRAERRFFPQHGAFPVEGCRVLAAELRNARRQRMERCPDRVGIVEKCEGGLVYTIEGNVNDNCARGAVLCKRYLHLRVWFAGVLKSGESGFGLSGYYMSSVTKSGFTLLWIDPFVEG